MKFHKEIDIFIRTKKENKSICDTALQVSQIHAKNKKDI